MRVKSFDRLNRQEKDYLIRRAEEARRDLLTEANRLRGEISRLSEQLREKRERIDDANAAIEALREPNRRRTATSR